MNSGTLGICIISLVLLIINMLWWLHFIQWNVYGEHYRFLSHDLYLFIKIISCSYFVLLLENEKPNAQLVQTPSLAMTLPEGIFDGTQQKNPRAHVTEQHLEHAL